MATLLLELFSEEIPSRMQRNAAEQLQRLMLAGFEKNMLVPTEVKTFVSPRHLAIQCFGLPTIQPDVKEEKRGPKIGAPEQALKGFLSASGLTLEQCEQRDGYYYATIERKGRLVAEVIKEVAEATLTAFAWPKSMHWGSRETRPVAWVRPLHRIVCLLDDQIVPVKFAHLNASNMTEGHRFLKPAPLKIAHAESYEETLQLANVVVDFAARRAQIKVEIEALAAKAKLSVVADEALLDEVTGLVEWPVPLLCQFDKKFLDLPPEVLISEMKNHQRYFALNDANGKLSDQFITVANMITADGGKQVKEGNARVVRARLADGEFYWEQDRKVKLEDWGKKLSDVVFHAKVGMMDKKVERIKILAGLLADELGGTNKQLVERAATLCKADLTSGMVSEFPELQGIMGRYYAKSQGESVEASNAICDHYKPLGLSDSVPTDKLAIILSIADKMDTLSTLFACNEIPTGSKDPLALRRAALGIFRTLITNEIPLNLMYPAVASLVFFSGQKTHKDLREYNELLLKIRAHSFSGDFSSSTDLITYSGDNEKIQKRTADTLQELTPSLGKLKNFFCDRLKNMLREEGIRHDVIEAVISSPEGGFDPVAIRNDALRLSLWLATQPGKDALAAIKRASNILAAEEKKAKTTFAPNTSSAQEPAEKAIAAALATSPSAPADLESLTAPINQFFTDLLVNEEGKREARLGLLAAVRATASRIADFSKIEG